MKLLRRLSNRTLRTRFFASSVSVFILLNLWACSATRTSQVFQNGPLLASEAPRYDRPVVSCDLVREVVVPSGHLVGDRAITFDQVRLEDWQYWNRVVYAHIAKYGPNNFNGAIRRLYIVKNLKIGDVSVAGTFFGRTILISVSANDRIFPDILIQSAIHHEIAGVLCLWFKQIPRERWSVAEDSEYTDDDPVDVARHGQFGLTCADPRLFERGFLTQYAKTNPLKDMCSFHERLMMSPEWMQIVADLHPPIKRKLQLWLEFLEKNEIMINPSAFAKELPSQDRDGGPAK